MRLPLFALTSPPFILTSTRSPLSAASILTSPLSESQFSFSIELSGSEGDHPDSSKSFVIGSVIFIILVGLKPHSFSLVFPIVGETQSYFRWDPSIDEAIVRVAYDAKACVRYDALMHELRTLGVRPDFITDEAWNRYPLDKDEDVEVTPNDVFLHVHTKDHDGVRFIDSRSAQFHAKLVKRREEHTQATPDQPIDNEQLYYDASEVCPKGRVYGLGSLARKPRRYADPGASTSHEPMVWHSEFDAVV
ncbi:hypothetical protein Syun_001689 [Stephania yunnanensis]|uniref:Uncharacterized protein n=1 Tax=Stephania yunnanensis TaxID=152371 RepID=A0AAP0LK11_9MAGN